MEHYTWIKGVASKLTTEKNIHKNQNIQIEINIDITLKTVSLKSNKYLSIAKLRTEMNDENKIATVGNIKNMIFSFRGSQVMIDRDLAELYSVETKVLNQAVKRNIQRFPNDFRFQLSDNEKTELVTNCDRFIKLKHSSVNPYVFTEQGVAMLSAVLRSELY